jgi:glucosyl-dolichyl phosphate glucuronosyltransferase
MVAAPRVSVVMCTYNRGGILADAVRSVVDQHDATPPFELIVVDNNSTDSTRDIVDRFTRIDSRVRYLFEPQQGLSYARNAGIGLARAPLIAFTDDDVRAEADWIDATVRAFDEHREADFVGGRVLPIWPVAPPGWLTRDHWMPLALVDYGDAPFAVTPARPVCLTGANFSLRRAVFDTLGPFATDLQRVKDSIGSLEDHEFIVRMLRTGRTGVYDPRITVHAEVQLDRLTKAYHRRWHKGHGHFYALMRTEEMESSIGTLFGVPAHLYRQALSDATGWLRAVVRQQSARRFLHEAGLHFFRGFLQTRRSEFVVRPPHERRNEIRRLVRVFTRRRRSLTGAGQAR